MKYLLLSFAFVVAVSTPPAAGAASSFAGDLAQLSAQRDEAIRAAIDPINRRYQASLEQLLRKAMQANDLETSVKIKEAISALSQNGVTAAQMVGTWMERRANAPSVPRVIKENGTFLHESGRVCHWKLDGNKLRLDYGGNRSDVFDLPGENGVLKGVTWNGEKVTLERNKSGL